MADLTLATTMASIAFSFCYGIFKKYGERRIAHMDNAPFDKK